MSNQLGIPRLPAIPLFDRSEFPFLDAQEAKTDVIRTVLEVAFAADLRVNSLFECLIFDDTIEHEAENNGDELRVVLIFDLWNPLLSEEERALTSRLAAVTREFGTRQNS
jgi:aspartyl/asparaginyl beta-hydroxylase (cupin superfamily)